MKKVIIEAVGDIDTGVGPITHSKLADFPGRVRTVGSDLVEEGGGVLGEDKEDIRVPLNASDGVFLQQEFSMFELLYFKISFQIFNFLRISMGMSDGLMTFKKGFL